MRQKIQLLLLIVILALTSCIPTKVAPRFKNKDYKVMLAKKFKRKLPRETSFIFKDTKRDGEFHNYINSKFGEKNRTYGNEYKITIDNKSYYFSYSETDKEDQTANLVPLFIDVTLNTTILQDAYTSRKGHWYILITIYDDALKNCLVDKHPLRNEMISYLKNLKKEYLNTANYNEILFNKKP